MSGFVHNIAITSLSSNVATAIANVKLWGLSVSLEYSYSQNTWVMLLTIFDESFWKRFRLSKFAEYWKQILEKPTQQTICCRSRYQTRKATSQRLNLRTSNEAYVLQQELKERSILSMWVFGQQRNRGCLWKLLDVGFSYGRQQH